MGYSHGNQWTEKNIEIAIKEVMSKAKINTMPTHTVMKEITGNEALSNAVRRHGGSKYFADKLNLEIKQCESKLGFEYECECINYLTNIFGYDCELTKARYPYDILVNDNIKVDVKCGNLYHGTEGNYYTFNLGKSKPTCDVYVCYCVNDDVVQKVYIIPSCVLSGKTQLSVGVEKSKYDKYINAWNIISKYDDFYKSVAS